MSEYNNTKMDKIVSTELYGKVFWNNKDPEKNRRFTISLLNNSAQFTITEADKEGKFKDGERFSVTMPYFNHAALSNMCKELMERLKNINSGKKVEKDNLIIFSGRSLKEARQKIEFNLYSADDNSEYKRPFVGYIKLSKRKDAEDKWEDKIIWLPTAKVVYRSAESKSATDYDTYTMLQDIAASSDAIVSRSSLSRDAHLKKYLKQLYGSDDDNKSGEYKGKNTSSEDDSFPFD